MFRKPSGFLFLCSSVYKEECGWAVIMFDIDILNNIFIRKKKYFLYYRKFLLLLCLIKMNK